MNESREGNIHLEHGQKVVLLGSCFSDNFAPKFWRSGFETLSNPLGTIFHPLALAEIIEDCFAVNEKYRTINRDDVWLDWRASSTVYGMSEKAIQSNMDSAFSQLKEGLSNAHLLVVTFGTAWGYFLKSGEIVANCHKLPQELFDKKMSSFDELFERWGNVLELLAEKNPNLKVVFTVSPIEHLKDGMVNNSRSKARLIELTAKLEELGAGYFYAYEWVKRHFQDAKFYEADGVHLNPQSIEMLWQTASNYFIKPESWDLAAHVTHINTMREHRSIHPESKAAIAFKEEMNRKMEAVSKAHPEVFWMDKL
ncbi:MAG: GSCFA domain-containing protein [Fluviicola sp.]